MFKMINGNGIKNEQKGYVVQPVDRFLTKYIDADGKTITIVSEPGLTNGKFCDIVERTNFNHWDNGAYIAKEKKDEIINNYRAALNFIDMELVIS